MSVEVFLCNWESACIISFNPDNTFERQAHFSFSIRRCKSWGREGSTIEPRPHNYFLLKLHSQYVSIDSKGQNYNMWKGRNYWSSTSSQFFHPFPQLVSLILNQWSKCFLFLLSSMYHAHQFVLYSLSCFPNLYLRLLTQISYSADVSYRFWLILELHFLFYPLVTYHL